MRLQIAYITPRRDLKSAPAQALVTEYVRRASRYAPVEAQAFRSEDLLIASATQRTGRGATSLILLDSRGRSFSSEQFAQHLGHARDHDTQQMVLAIGPPDGWSEASLRCADLRLSLGAMTLPHELALVVLCEQVYRALTILAGHPYHSGHGETDFL